MNYEDELEEVIFKNIGYIYNISDLDVLYRYLVLRKLCIDTFNNSKQEYLQDFAKFILNELAIVKMEYKGQPISLVNDSSNCIMSIIENIEFRVKLNTIIDENNKKYSFDEYINKIWLHIDTLSKKKSKNYLKDPYYKYHLIYNRLFLLNNLFGVKSVNDIPYIDGFIQDLDHFLTMEDVCLRYIHSSNFKTNNIKSVTEEDLETFLYKNLHLIEEGLKPIDRQVIIDEGRIDILAKDKNGRFVILELKISNDKHLIWQVMYYPEAIKNNLGILNPRVITVCPSYPNYILSPLKQLNYVEIFQYKAELSNNKLTSINLNKIA